MREFVRESVRESVRAPALEEDGKKRFSASENHFLEPLPLHKALA